MDLVFIFSNILYDYCCDSLVSNKQRYNCNIALFLREEIIIAQNMRKNFHSESFYQINYEF